MGDINPISSCPWLLRANFMGTRACEAGLCQKVHLASEQSEPQSRSNFLSEEHWAPTALSLPGAGTRLP